MITNYKLGKTANVPLSVLFRLIIDFDLQSHNWLLSGGLLLYPAPYPSLYHTPFLVIPAHYNLCRYYIRNIVLMDTFPYHLMQNILVSLSSFGPAGTHPGRGSAVKNPLGTSLLCHVRETELTTF